MHGRVLVVAAAHDTPSLPAPPPWTGMPVTPARITWRLSTVGGVPIMERTAVDFRFHLPPEGQFWNVYERGSYQNMPVVGSFHYSSMPGRYLFRLTRRALDVSSLLPGTYALTVTANDIRGNRGSLTVRFNVWRPGGSAGPSSRGGERRLRRHRGSPGRRR